VKSDVNVLDGARRESGIKLLAIDSFSEVLLKTVHTNITHLGDVLGRMWVHHAIVELVTSCTFERQVTMEEELYV
jgi:hypothetical protein